MKRALVSVSDKAGIVDFCLELVKNGYEIISTGGTAKTLEENGIKVIGISDITGFPECLDGRVKTLHPNVHAGLLAIRSNAEHMRQLKELNIATIDMVVVNLYPFKKTIENPNVEFQDAVENIDIGGPTMLRSAAKNFQDVVVLVDPKDYKTVLSQIEEKGDVDIETKKYLMYKVYAHTAYYDSLISNFLAQKLGIEFPDKVTFAYDKAQDMRYGENPHQKGSFYREPFDKGGSLSKAVQLHGKELSYNNINDTNGALELLREYNEPCVVAVKHANPCGVGVGKNLYEAYIKAFEGDKISIFGGIIALNGVVDKATAEEISKIFIEIVIAKDFDADAFEILSKKKNIRLLKLEDIGCKRDEKALDMKKVYSGLLIQNIDNSTYNKEDLKVVTKRVPTEKELQDLDFCWKVVKHTKSNAIVIGKDGGTAGVGAGQTNRIWATSQAIEHAGENARGCVLASDAFFPFGDCVEEAGKYGITAIIQPGGSINDNQSIEACDRLGIAMVFCGERHFQH